MAFEFGCEHSVFFFFLVKDNLIREEVDPEANFFQDILSFDAKYHSPIEMKQSFKNLSEDAVFIFHVNVRSMKKHFESFKDL